LDQTERITQLMRPLRVSRVCVTVFLLIVAIGIVLHTAPFKNIRDDNAGAGTGSESSAGRAPTDFQLDRDPTILECAGTSSTAVTAPPVAFVHVAQDKLSSFASAVEFPHLDLSQRQHALRI
jgi:hypothetical protein